MLIYVYIYIYIKFSPLLFIEEGERYGKATVSCSDEYNYYLNICFVMILNVLLLMAMNAEIKQIN